MNDSNPDDVVAAGEPPPLLPPPPDLERLGRVAFEAYSDARAGVAHDGGPIPAWSSASREIRDAWVAAAAAVLSAASPGAAE